MTGHLGYERGDPAGRGSGNSRNGTTPKTVATEVGDIRLDQPRDRNGSFADVALGYDSLAAAQKGQLSMGSFIGRYANRIGNARFTLDGVEYKLAANAGANSLHGGARGSRFFVAATAVPVVVVSSPPSLSASSSLRIAVVTQVLR